MYAVAKIELVIAFPGKRSANAAACRDMILTVKENKSFNK